MGRESYRLFDSDGVITPALLGDFPESLAPPVDEPTRIGAELPPVVVVPAHPRPGGGGISLELSAEVIGAPVAIVFSTVELLIQRLGAYQPWIMIPSAALPDFLGTAAISIVLDPAPAVCRPRWTAERLHALEEQR